MYKTTLVITCIKKVFIISKSMFLCFSNLNNYFCCYDCKILGFFPGKKVFDIFYVYKTDTTHAR